MSGIGRGHEWGGTTYDAYFPCLAAVAGFYLTHWEKYITGVLYLPWLYDIIQLVLKIEHIGYGNTMQSFVSQYTQHLLSA